MKKVISLFLTVVMALSMFSCLSVMAGAATSDLVVDQEYTVPSGTTKVFVPQESGYYRFTSNGVGDPRITITCLGGEYVFDDEKGSDFSGVVELEAGEEVSCYLYNYNGSDCVFTITKTLGVESISYTLAEPIELIENMDGDLDYWEGEYEAVEWFRYKYTGRDGDILTVNYTDGSSVDFVYAFYSYEDSEGNRISAYDLWDSDQSYENQWTAGNTYEFVITYMGKEFVVPASVVESPVEAFCFSPSLPSVIEVSYEDTQDQWFWSNSAEKIVPKDSTLTVNYRTGETVEYAYDGIDSAWCSGNGDGFNMLFVADGDYLLIECWAPHLESYPVEFGNEYELTFKFMGKEFTHSVTIDEYIDPYESISFTLSEPLEIMENTNGYISDDYIWDDVTQTENAVEYYRYFMPSIYSEGNKITVNYTDGTSDVYVFDIYSYSFVNSSGDTLAPYDDIDCFTNQSYNNQWTVGSENYIIVEAFGKTTEVPVTIVENPYESISFTLAEPIEIMENTNGYISDDYIWDDESETERYVEYFRYYIPDIERKGNSLTVNYKDGTSDVYTFDSDSGSFMNSSGEDIEIWYSANQSYYNQWTLGSENYIIVEAFGKTTEVPVTIVENPYESIEFIPVEPLSIEQFTNGYWTTIYNDETGEEETVYCYFDYDLVYKTGNVINLFKKDGTKESYICDDGTFLNSEGEFLRVDYSSDSVNWVVGSGNTITVKAMGQSCEINVTLIGNTSVINNNSFVAEKVSDDTCVITRVNLSENFNGTLYIPEAIDGYSVVGIGDGVLDNVYGLEELNLPSTFNMISEYLFNGCYSLKAINVSEENKLFASVNGILYNKALTEILYCPASFTGEFIIKAGVTELSPEIVACLAKASSVEVESGNTAFAFEDGILYNSDFTKIYKAFSTDSDYVMKSTVTEIADYSFSGNDTIESVVFSAGVTEISYAAFMGCSALSSVDLPDSLVSIDEQAFNGNENLSSITLPNTTKSVGSYAFYDCSSLAEVNLNAGLESLGSFAFYSSDIEKIILPNSLRTMNEGCFAYNEKLSDITIGTGLTSISEYCFALCSSLEGVNIPGNVTVLGSDSFSCTGLKSISLHNKMTTIDRAFVGCEGLTEVNVPDSVVSMDGAFSGCINLTYAGVGSGVRSMNSAFNGCEKLETVELSEGLSGSCDYAFKGCGKLDEIDLPSTVTELSYAQFENCKNIDAFDIPETLIKIEAHALDNTGWYNNQADGDVYLEHIYYAYKGDDMPSGYTLDFKSGTKAVADSALEKQNNLVGVKFPGGFEYIGDYAFDGCSGLKSVTIPASVEYIGEYSLGYAYNNGRNICKYEDFIIYGVENSVADTYAKENGFTFIPVEHSHTKSGWIIDTAATCTEKGSKHKECTECGEILETAEIPATGHTKVTDKAVAPTCTATGKTEGSHCSVCNAVIKAQTIVPAKGHTVSDWIIVDEPTCVEGGYKYKECTECGEFINDSGIPATGHTKGSWITDKKATVNAAGSKHKECTVCGETLETAEIAQLKPGRTTVKATTTSTGVKISWSKVTGADSYTVYRKTGSGSYKAIKTVTGTSYTDTTAKSGTKYKYNVKAKNEAGYGEYAKSGVTKLFLATPKVTVANASSGVTVKWNKITGAKGYYVYRKASGAKSWTKIATVKSGTTVSYTDKKASAGKKYYYTVKAYNGDYVSTTKASAIIERLKAPTIKSVTSGKSGVTVKWAKATGADGYYVYRKTGSGSYTKIATVKGNAKVSYLDKSAKKGKTYTYYVKAYSGKSVSTNSKTLKIKDKY